MSTTLVRTITAAVLVVIVITSALVGNQYFVYLTHVFTILLQFELALLLFRSRAKQLVLPFVFQCFTTSLIFCYAPEYFIQFFLIFWTVSLSVILIGYSDRENADLFSIMASYILGFTYVGILPALTTKLMLTFNGPYWFFLCLCVVFSGDIAAYFVGRKFGKNKLLPTISPNKTWEGAAGGLAASILVGVYVGKYFFPHFNSIELIAACAIAGFLAQSGDFFESLIKRIAGSKDSGYLLPGHGGFLDRFDGILFAIPVFFYIAS